jgi:hypothetical protein
MAEADATLSGGDVGQMDLVERRITWAATHAETVARDLRQRLAQQPTYGPLTALAASRLNGQILPHLDQTVRDLRGYAARLRAAITAQTGVSAAATVAGLGAGTRPPQKNLPGVAYLSLEDINRIIANPGQYSVEVLAAAIAMKDLLEHQEQWRRSNPHVGKFRGNRARVNPNDPNSKRGTKSDCTIFVDDVFQRAFDLKGEGETWQKIYAEATRRSGANGLQGNVLMQVMREKLDWRGVYFSPNPADPTLHGRNNVLDASGRTVKYYGVPVDPDMEVVNYRSGATTDAMDKLSMVDVGLGISNGANHMFVYVGGKKLPGGQVAPGKVVEMHWNLDATHFNVIEATALQDWARHNKDGVILAPRDDLERAFGQAHEEPKPPPRPRR